MLIDGQNRGIGRAICQRILTTEPNVSPLKLFATTRSGQDLGLESTHATRSVIYPKLDITDRSSVRSFAKEVTQYGSVDVLINNAGINLDNEYSAANAQKTMDVNYTAMLDVSLYKIQTCMCRADSLSNRCAKHSSHYSISTDES